MGDLAPELREYWELFYADGASKAVPRDPTAFAAWVGDRLRTAQSVVEFGFGNGRDSLWFMSRGHELIGFDFAESAVRRAQEQSSAQELAGSFSMLNLYDTSAVDAAVKVIKQFSPEPAIYGRFLLHSLQHHGRHNLFDLAARTLADGGEMYLEFRTGQDRGQPHAFGDDHFRAYLDPHTVEEEIVSHGGVVQHLESGHGLAVYRTEDPHVARLVATWPR